MIKSRVILVMLIISTIIISSCGNKKADEQSTSTPESSEKNKQKIKQELLAANDSFYAALNAMFIGNLEPMNALWSQTSYVTDMGPFGDRLTGWEAVGAEFKKEAGMKLGGKITCKDVHSYVGTDMGYVVCVEEGENMSAEGKPVVVRFRATNIFQLVNGQWKMVHHHTDLSPPLEKATNETNKK